MSRRVWPAWAAFLVLFVAYQLPEGVGMRWLGSFPVQAALLLLFFPVAWAVARARGFRGADAYALERRPGALRALGLTFALALLVKALAVAVGLWLGVYALGEAAPVGAIAVPLAGIVFTTFFPSIAEDIVTRGFWYRQAPSLGHGAVFVLATSAVYVLNHVYRLGSGPVEWAMLFAFGLAYAVALVRTGTLWGAVGLHWGWNVAAFAADSVFGVETVGEVTAPFLSAAAHLVALGVIWAATMPRRRMAALAV